ncbi:MAG: iron-containing alcohol dehydrogenase [Pikeienuella sp.]|uniref:iron-containing alcohol dehydrogenase n=1 Tax=Pikeienuella sp. TaxID=2831957 RepID=UPI00391A856C
MSLIAYVTRIHFADRVVEDALPVELRRLGLSRPLIVTDEAGRRGDAFDRILDALPPGAAAAAAPAPDRLSPEALLAAARRFEAAGADGVIGLGGPVALDLARALAKAGPESAGAREPVPMIAAPTTTASVGLGPVSSALGLSCAAPTPALLICDPTLTMEAGPQETAAAGMDALIHCLEAFLCATWNPPADGIALDGMRRAAAHVEHAVRDGADPDARRELLAAALDAGLAAQKGLGGVRALAHALEEETGRAPRHGELHIALVGPVLAFNAPALEAKLEAAAEALRLPAGQEPGAGLAALGARLGLPARLGPLDIGEPALRRAARRAAEDPATQTNPRLATMEDYLRILEDAR